MRYFFSTDLPEDEDEFIRRMVAAHAEGVAVGRIKGAQEIVGRVEKWVRDTYYSPEIKRGTPYAEDILDLANKLVNGLLHGDLGRIDANPEKESQS